MSRFLTKFDATLLDERTRQGRRLWRLDSPLSYFSSLVDMVFTVPAGYVTDLESCPRIPVFYLLAGDLVQEPAALHDYLYSHAVLPRAACDAILREAAIATGTPKWQAELIYAGVRLGGASHYGDKK